MTAWRTHAPILILMPIAAWLWWPALYAVPVEGFSAMIASIGMAIQSGDLSQVDAAYPLDTEFYFLTRLGMSGSIALLRPTGLSADAIFTVLTVLSFAVSTIAIFIFARQWTRASAASILLALIVLPGLSESAFFQHENLLALALFSLSLILLGASQTRWTAAVSGILLGLALLTRSDFILLSPALPLILWARGHDLNQVVIATLIGGAATALTVLAILAAFGATPLDILAVIRRSVDLWHKEPRWDFTLLEAVIFIGLPGLIFLVIGVVSVIREKSFPKRLLVLAVPFIFLVIYGEKLWQARQFLPITPFLVVIMATGAEALWRWLPGAAPRALACSALLFISLWPSITFFSDGPRSLTGRLWSPLVWRDWQSQVGSNIAVIDREIEGLGDRGVIVTDDWNIDRYTHLAFREQGWLPVSDSTCGENVEVWRKQGRTAFHARLHMPFFKEWRLAVFPLLTDFANRCLPEISASSIRTLSVSHAKRSETLPAFLQPPAYASIEVVPVDRATLLTVPQLRRFWAAGTPLSLEATVVKRADLGPVTGLLE